MLYSKVHNTWKTILKYYIIYGILQATNGHICPHYHALVMCVPGNIPIICHTKLFKFLKHARNMTRYMYLILRSKILKMPIISSNSYFSIQHLQ